MLIEIRFKVKNAYKATLSPVQYCHPAEGGLYLGGLITGCIFLFPDRWDYNRGEGEGAYKRGSGGYNRNFTVLGSLATIKLKSEVKFAAFWRCVDVLVMWGAFIPDNELGFRSCNLQLSMN